MQVTSVARLRTKVAAAAMEERWGKIAIDSDYDLLVTGATRLLKPDGKPLLVYLPGVIPQELRDASYTVLHKVRGQTDNRGLASGSKRILMGGKGGRTRSKLVASSIIGYMDAHQPYSYCRLTAFTAREGAKWKRLFPLFQSISEQFAAMVPERYQAQMDYVRRTPPDWVVPGTPFTTITVNSCVDPETQCLTKEHGWTDYRKLSVGDTILAYDPKTDTTRWEPVLNVFVNDNYRGEMVHLSAGTSQNGKDRWAALVTPDHRWPLRPGDPSPTRPNTRSVKVKRTFELPTSHYWSLIRNAPHEDAGEPVYPDVLVRVIAWYITEGSVRNDGLAISICQSERVNPQKTENIRQDLRAIGARPLSEWPPPCLEQGCDKPGTTRGRCNKHFCRWRGEYIKEHGKYDLPKTHRGPGRGKGRKPGLWVSERRRDDGMVYFELSGTDVDKLTQFAPGPQKVPTAAFIGSLTTEQARMFVETCIAADGYAPQNRFYQTDPGRMDAFVAAAVLAGMAPSVYGLTCTSDVARPRINMPLLRRKSFYYEGPIWCPQTVSGHWVAKRRGSVFITGNTYSTGFHTDKGDLDEGFSTLAVLRKGSFSGGRLVFPQYRVAVDMQDGDLLLMDAHEAHGNTLIKCNLCDAKLSGPRHKCSDDEGYVKPERISVVAYYRTRVVNCGTAEEEAAKAAVLAEKRSS